MRLVRRLLVVVFALSLVGGALWFPHAGQFLVDGDAFDHAEIALVLSGESIGRSLAARDLYRQGKVDRIVVVPDPVGRTQAELVRLGLADSKHPQWAERILLASGVPPSNVTFLPEPVDGTIVEALRVREFLRGRFPKRLVVVTSRLASRRACYIFRHIFRDESVTIICSPTPYDSCEPDRWWAHPRTALYVLMEYQKFLVNALTLALQLQTGHSGLTQPSRGSQ